MKFSKQQTCIYSSLESRRTSVPRQPAGRPPTIFEAVIAASIAEAVQRDLENDSLTSTEELMTLVDNHTLNEQEA